MTQHTLREYLLIAGAVFLIGGSFTIESSIILLLTSISRETLANGVKVGIASVLAGTLLLFAGKRLKR